MNLQKMTRTIKAIARMIEKPFELWKKILSQKKNVEMFINKENFSQRY